MDGPEPVKLDELCEELGYAFKDRSLLARDSQMASKR